MDFSEGVEICLTRGLTTTHVVPDDVRNLSIVRDRALLAGFVAKELSPQPSKGADPFIDLLTSPHNSLVERS